MDRVGEASEAGKHRMVGRSGTSATQAKPPATTAEEAKLGNSAPSEQSWLGSLGIWGQGQQQPNATHDSTAKLASINTSDRSQSVEAADEASGGAVPSRLPRPASGLLPASSSGGESSWEKLSSLAADSGEEAASPKDDYAAITAQLAAVGPAAGTRAKSKRPAASDAKARLAQRQPRRSSKEVPSAAAATAPSALKPPSASQPNSPQYQDPESPKPAAATPTSPQQQWPTATNTSPAAEAQRQTSDIATAASSSDADGDLSQAAANMDIDNTPQGNESQQALNTDTAESVQAPERSESPTTSGRQPAARSTTAASRPPLAQPASSPLPSSHATPDAFVSTQGNRLFRKSMEVANWLKASTDAALSVEPSTKQRVAIQQQWQCTPEDVEAVLVWQNQRCSTKVFLGGMYALICCRQLVLGVEVLQPSSAIAGVLLALMLLNVARVALLASRGRSSNPAEREHALQSRITQWALRGFAHLAPVLGAVAAMLYRRLSGHDRTGTTVWLGLVLWGIMGLGEAGFMQQSSLAIGLWCCLFGLPCLYLQCRHILDALVEESLHLVALSLRTGCRNTFALAGGTGLLVLAIAPFGTFARFSLALLSSWTVLFWKACLTATRSCALHAA